MPHGSCSVWPSPTCARPSGSPSCARLPERIAAGAAGVPADAIHRVIDEHCLRRPGVDGVHSRRQVIHDRRLGRRPIGDVEPETGDDGQRVDAAGQQAAAHDTVDVAFGQSGVTDRRDRSLQNHGQLGRFAAITGVRRQAEADDRSTVLGGYREAMSSPSSTVFRPGRKAYHGAPSRSIQVSSTGRPMRNCSGGQSTTVLTNRRPGCSSSSTAASGQGVE